MLRIERSASNPDSFRVDGRWLQAASATGHERAVIEAAREDLAPGETMLYEVHLMRCYHFKKEEVPV